MTTEEIKDIFDTTESNWKGDNAFQGLQILSKYTHKDVLCGAEQDMIHSVYINEVAEKITKEDVIALAKLNWHIEFGDTFACFV